MREAEIQERIAGVLETVDRFQKNLPDDWRGKTSKEIMDEIYDEHGLPV